jgi:hypothetical protein
VAHHNAQDLKSLAGVLIQLSNLGDIPPPRRVQNTAQPPEGLR